MGQTAKAEIELIVDFTSFDGRPEFSTLLISGLHTKNRGYPIT
jgi:hypothetical protein